MLGWGFNQKVIINPLNPMGRYTGSHMGDRVQNTLRAGIPAFAMVFQKPEENVNRLT